jgi:Flp pilus assembly pilin Flp
MKSIFKTFRNDESGAVTVDWVVLTAAMVLLGLLIMVAIGGGAQTAADWMKTTMETMM